MLLVIPSTAFPAPAANYSLQSGTVWIRSKLIAADAVEGAFTGLRIQGGVLKLSAPATIAAGVIVLNITTLLELDLKLQEPSIPPFPLTGPGGDAVLQRFRCR